MKMTFDRLITSTTRPHTYSESLEPEKTANTLVPARDACLHLHMHMQVHTGHVPPAFGRWRNVNPSSGFRNSGEG